MQKNLIKRVNREITNAMLTLSVAFVIGLPLTEQIIELH